ncbi:hypothetical protein [Streptomyces sp. NPDC051364]|uniref:hypothetical protein n=1 Tax=Streptomyces sp. NPDC051364 TaxID=3155799 RepID=UPI003442929A
MSLLGTVQRYHRADRYPTPGTSPLRFADCCTWRPAAKRSVSSLGYLLVVHLP